MSTLKLSGALKLGSLASAPANPAVGMEYYNSTDSKYYRYNGTSWVESADFGKLSSTSSGQGASLIGIQDANTQFTATTVEGALDEALDAAQAAQSTIDTHLNGGANKHDASEVDFELADGSKKNIQASSDDVENAIRDLDTAIGVLDTTPTNYTPASASVVASHLEAIDGVLANVGATEFSDSAFRIKDNGDATKKLAFEVSAITTATTRTVTMPDANVDLGLIATAIQSSEKGAANGVASLDAGGKVPVSQLPNAIMEYQGVYNATTNSPALADGAGNADSAIGNVYRVGTAGTQDFGSGSITFAVGDYVILNASKIWEKADTTDAVSSVNSLTGAVVLVTDDIAEDGSPVNKWFTDARAKAAAVADSITNGVTDVAPSQNAVFDALALKLANVSEDTTPELGGNLTLGANVLIHDADGMKRGSSATDFLEEEYLHSVSLSASQTNTVIAALTFAHASFEGCEVVYKVKEATSNDVRIGTLRIVTNGTDVVLNDMSTETADVGISFDAVVNGTDINIRYSSGANACTMRADVKRIKA